MKPFAQSRIAGSASFRLNARRLRHSAKAAAADFATTMRRSPPCSLPIHQSRSKSSKCRNCCRFPASSSRCMRHSRSRSLAIPASASKRPMPRPACSRPATATSTPCRSIRSAAGALYQVYAAPGQVTDVALQEGEQLVGSGPVAAGDTVRWIIGDTESGTGPTKRIHILVKPTRPELVSNLVINTDRRTYLLELRSAEKTYMASVSWQYPEDQLIALRRQNASAEAATPIVTGVDISRLRFRYAIEGDNPPWRPVSAFDDGSKVYIEMPARNRARRSAAAVRHRPRRRRPTRQLSRAAELLHRRPPVRRG